MTLQTSLSPPGSYGMRDSYELWLLEQQGVSRNGRVSYPSLGVQNGRAPLNVDPSAIACCLATIAIPNNAQKSPSQSYRIQKDTARGRFGMRVVCGSQRTQNGWPRGRPTGRLSRQPMQVAGSSPRPEDPMHTVMSLVNIPNSICGDSPSGSSTSYGTGLSGNESRSTDFNGSASVANAPSGGPLIHNWQLPPLVRLNW